MGEGSFCELQNLLATLSRPPQTIVFIVAVLSGQMGGQERNSRFREKDDVLSLAE